MSEELEEVVESVSKRGISRRNLIKGGVIVGGTLWVAPVVESFTSKAYAGSLPHYCCSCFLPVSGQSGALSYQGESDNHPPSAADCAMYCSGLLGSSIQGTAYQNFTWCGPSSVGLTYSSTGFGSNGPGCYQPGSGNLVPIPNNSICVSGAVDTSTGGVSGSTTVVEGTYVG